jgi:hypothetical protein
LASTTARSITDLPGALAQRRDLEGEAVEPEEEVAAEAAAPHGRVEVAVGGGDEADVDGPLLDAPDAPHLELLQHAQELGLHGGASSPTSSRKTVPPAALSRSPAARRWRP